MATRRLLLGAALLLAAARAGGQDHQVRWFTVNNGGRPCATFSHRINGSFAQAVQSSGIWPDNRGFWGFWVPELAGLHRVDVGVERILSPTGDYRTNDDVFPAACWRNMGTGPVDFTAYCFIANPAGTRVYSRQLEVRSLGPGAADTVEFDAYNVGTTTGWWIVRCSTYAAGDEYRPNDSREADFRVSGLPPPEYGWVEAASVPPGRSSRPVKDGGWLAGSGDGRIFCAKGNKTSDFYCCDPAAGCRWSTLESIPSLEQGVVRPPYRGCRGVSDGSRFVYMTKGNNTLGFWRYDAAMDTWLRLEDVPAGDGRRVKGGCDLAYVVQNDTGLVYLLKGQRTEFYRFNTTSGKWMPRLPDVPSGGKAKFDNGSFMVFDGTRYLYAHQARYTGATGHYMFRFDLAGDTWRTRTLTGMPLWGLQGGRWAKKRSKDGGCGAWMSGCIYALKGGNTQQFFRYYPLQDSWAEMDTLPSYGTTMKKRMVKNGGDMAYSAPTGLYALKGNKTLEFWHYVHPPEASGRPERSGVMAAASAPGPMTGASVAAAQRLTIAPNPLTSGLASLRFSRPFAGPCLVRVFDALGRCALTRSFDTRNSDFGLPLDLRRLSSGVYLVKVKTIGNDLCEKLIIQR